MFLHFCDTLVNLKHLLLKKSSFIFLNSKRTLIFAEFAFVNRAYLRYFAEQIFMNSHFSLKFEELNFANLPQIHENIFLPKFVPEGGGFELCGLFVENL